MNIAILFDSAEEDTKINCPMIGGQEIYLYALKTFYLHSDIDAVFYMCRYTDTLSDVFSHISLWREKSGISKPVAVLHGIRHFAQIWLHILQSGQERPEKYVIHDVRFPFVTEKRITDVLQMSSEYGIAMFSEDVEEGLYQIGEEKIEILPHPRYLRYPAAVRAESRALHCLDEPRFVLRDLGHYEPWFCEDSEENIAVYGSEDIERAEVLLRYGAAETRGSKTQSIPAGEKLQPEGIMIRSGEAAV